MEELEKNLPVSRRKLISALAAGGIGAVALVTLKSLPEVKGLVLSGNPDFVELTPFAGTPTKRSNSDMLIFSNANDNNEPYLEDTSGNISLMRTQQPADYIIELIGSTYYARPAPNSGLTAYSGSSAVTVIQSALNALPSTGGVVYLKENVTASGLVTINKSNVTLKCDLRISTNTTSANPSIQQIKLDASAGGLYAIILQGINMKELDFYANGNAIRAVSVDDCLIQKDGTYHGVVFQEDAGAVGWFDDISFHRTHFVNHTGATDGATWGLVSWVSAPNGVTQIVFDNCTFEGYDNNQSFFLCDGASAINSMTVNKCRFYHSTGTTGDYVFYQKTASQNTYPTGFTAVFTNNFVETDRVPLTLIYAETRGSYWKAGLNFSAIGNIFELGGTVTLMTYADGAGAAWGQAGALIFEGNESISPSATGLFSIGTPPDPTVLTRIIKNNSPFLCVTQNGGTSTQNGTGAVSAFTVAHGLVSAPSKWNVIKGAAGLPGIEYVTANATNLTVNFTTAPASGTSNIVMIWSAEV